MAFPNQDKKPLLPHDEVMGPPEGAPPSDMDGDEMGMGGKPAFYSDDPETEDAAREGITVNPDEGGLCYGCAFLEGQTDCTGYGGPLTVDCDQISECVKFRPKLGASAGGVGGGGGMGGGGMGGPEMGPAY